MIYKFTDLVTELSEETGYTKIVSAEVINALIKIMIRLLSNGVEFRLKDFGVFKITEHKSRIGRNPKTGEEVPIKARRMVKFCPNKDLKKRIEDLQYED